VKSKNVEMSRIGFVHHGSPRAYEPSDQLLCKSSRTILGLYYDVLGLHYDDHDPLNHYCYMSISHLWTSGEYFKLQDEYFLPQEFFESRCYDNQASTFASSFAG